MILHLIRFAYLEAHTLGRLRVGSLELATLERPYIPAPAGPGGKRRVSCIPDGTYRVIPHSSARFPDVWALINPARGVWYQPGDIPAGQSWGRSAILVHAGNTVDDVIGCIAVGEVHGLLGGRQAVLRSRAALDRLRGVLGRSEHELVIAATAGTDAIDAAA